MLCVGWWVWVWRRAIVEWDIGSREVRFDQQQDLWVVLRICVTIVQSWFTLLLISALVDSDYNALKALLQGGLSHLDPCSLSWNIPPSPALMRIWLTIMREFSLFSLFTDWIARETVWSRSCSHRYTNCYVSSLIETHLQLLHDRSCIWPWTAGRGWASLQREYLFGLQSSRLNLSRFSWWYLLFLFVSADCLCYLVCFILSLLLITGVGKRKDTPHTQLSSWLWYSHPVRPCLA